MIRPWMVYTVLVVVLCCFTAWLGWSACDTRWQLRDNERKLSEAATVNHAWAERFTLQAQLATRDQQLAEAQQTASEARTETIIKREVIYRDKIKIVAVRDCVADSGLLDVYDATLGLSDPTKRSDDRTRCAYDHRRQSGSGTHSDEAQRRCASE